MRYPNLGGGGGGGGGRGRGGGGGGGLTKEAFGKVSSLLDIFIMHLSLY